MLKKGISGRLTEQIWTQTCDRCGKRTQSRHCKLTCTNCGGRLDCSDLFIDWERRAAKRIKEKQR